MQFQSIILVFIDIAYGASHAYNRLRQNRARNTLSHGKGGWAVGDPAFEDPILQSKNLFF